MSIFLILLFPSIGLGATIDIECTYKYIHTSQFINFQESLRKSNNILADSFENKGWWQFWLSDKKMLFSIDTTTKKLPQALLKLPILLIQ